MLSQSAIDGIFGRLTATYGKPFLAQYDGIKTAAVHAAWAKQLADYNGNKAAFQWAYDHLPERPPNAVVFRALLRSAPAAQAPALSWAPKPSPGVAKLALAALKPRQPVDRLAWARRVADGDGFSLYAKKAAREVLARQKIIANARVSTVLAFEKKTEDHHHDKD